MKTIEIFLDESGEIDPAAPQDRMVVAGLVLKADGPKTRGADESVLERFHGRLYTDLCAAGKLVGVCDRERNEPDDVRKPAAFLAKRPRDGGDWTEHWSHIASAASKIDNCAGNKIEIAAFALTFPANTATPIHTTPPELATLTDQSYFARVKDALEFLLFETPFITSAYAGGIDLSLNLATRSASFHAEENAIEELLDLLKNDWGHNGYEGPENGKILCDTVLGGSAAPILGSVISRRPHAWQRVAQNITVRRCCCCKLMDWHAWEDRSKKDEDPEIQGDRRRANYFQFQVLPRQIHYFADFVCNGMFWLHQSRILETSPFKAWFKRGFVLNAIDANVDAWLNALRSFANGNKAHALLDLHRMRALSLAQGNATALKRRTKTWPEELTGPDYRAIFQNITRQIQMEETN